MTMQKISETQWYLPGRYYGCVDVDMALPDGPRVKAMVAHPVTQGLIAAANKSASPCAFCEARSTRHGIFLDSLVILAGKPIVCVYTLCDTCYYRPRSWDRPLYAFRGGLSGAGASSTDSKIAAKIERGF
jgi:hypothetical protein